MDNIKKISLKNNEKVKKILYFYCNWANMAKYSQKLNLSSIATLIFHKC